MFRDKYTLKYNKITSYFVNRKIKRNIKFKEMNKLILVPNTDINGLKDIVKSICDLFNDSYHKNINHNEFFRLKHNMIDKDLSIIEDELLFDINDVDLFLTNNEQFSKYFIKILFIKNDIVYYFYKTILNKEYFKIGYEVIKVKDNSYYVKDNIEYPEHFMYGRSCNCNYCLLNRTYKNRKNIKSLREIKSKLNDYEGDL